MADEINHDNEPDSGYPRLEQQIRWYDCRSISAQRWYKATKIVEIVCAAIVPLCAHVCATLTGTFGVIVIVLEGLQQLNHWSENWITYRSTCEALRHEKYSYLGGSGVYEGKTAEDASRTLTGRVEALISTEHAKWISRQEYSSKRKPK